MKGIGKAVFADIRFIRRKILSVAVHVRQDIHIIMLEHVVQLPQIRPSLIMEKTVADGGTDDNAVITHDSPVTDYLCRQRLHHLDRIGPHAVSVMKILRHAEYHHVVFFLRPRNIRSLVCDLPGNRHHLSGIA